MKHLAAAFRRLPARVRFAMLIFLTTLGLCLVFRLAFWALFASSAPPATARSIAKALYLGLKFDVRLSIITALPLLILPWIPALDLTRSLLARRIWLGYLVAAAGVVNLVYFVDFGHYDWQHGRFTAAVLQHTTEGDIAATILWESYPIVPAAIALVALTALYGWSMRRWAFRVLEPGAAALSRKARVGLSAAIVLLCVGGLNGKLAGYPLRWGDAASTNPFVEALGLNPVLYFVDTMRMAPMTCDREAVRKHYDEVAAYLGVPSPDRAALLFARRAQPGRRLPIRPNFVIVFLESFGAFKTGIFGSTLDPTPNYDALARRSLFFPSFYVPSLPTGRSVFATITGIPDLNPSDSSSNDPKLVRKPTLVNAFDGYEKMYFYTGNLSWENLRGLLGRNIPDIRMFEQPDYASPRTDGWGISDLALFEESHKVFRRERDKPFIAFVHTSGNHRPYTIPRDKAGFREIEADSESLRKNDFSSLAEFNSLRFMDHALGRFFEIARQEPYYRDTIFMVYGDHGSRGAGTNPLQSVRLTSHHVPFFIHGPAFFPEPKVIETPVSSMDVLPTAAGLAGVPYENGGMGRDMFAPRAEGAEGVYTWIGLIDREFFLYVGGSGQKLFRYRSEKPLEDVSAAHPERREEMARRWKGLHETARYLLCQSPEAPERK